jgi:hypothetical protein
MIGVCGPISYVYLILNFNKKCVHILIYAYIMVNVPWPFNYQLHSWKVSIGFTYGFKGISAWHPKMLFFVIHTNWNHAAIRFCGILPYCFVAGDLIFCINWNTAVRRRDKFDLIATPNTIIDASNNASFALCYHYNPFMCVVVSKKIKY